MNILNAIFIENVISNFHFLEKYNMVLKESWCQSCVRYQSDLSWLEVWYDKLSLSVDMGLMGSDIKQSLWSIKKFKTGEASSTVYMASTESKIKKGLNKLANCVELYCHEALRGEIEFYEKLQQYLNDDCSKSIRGKISSDIESYANDAWKSKNYAKVIELYSPLFEHLTPVQKKRLQICVKLVNSS